MRKILVDDLQKGDIVVNDFEFNSRYWVHFLTNTLLKRMKPLIYPIMDERVPLLFFNKDSFGIR